jgi:hypothetical protein
MSHYGNCLGGMVCTPGAERQAPPARPEDRPRYGQIGPSVLAALETPATVAELAARLGWDEARAKSWVHAYSRRGLVKRVDWVKAPSGQRAGRYQRVTA